MNLPPHRNVCVYSASSEGLDAIYHDAARDLGTAIGACGWTLIYGGGERGLMGDLARAVHAAGGRVIGVIPERLRDLDLAYAQADELIVTGGMRERKAIMEDRADGFIVLPGGFGTLEEFFEILVLKQLAYTRKPLILYNTNAFFDGLMAFFAGLCEQQFVKENHLDLFLLTESPRAALDAIANPPDLALEAKYLR
jgi:uncharacterized protein (TIGR00730 family)